MKQAGNHARALARGALLLSLGVSGAVPGALLAATSGYLERWNVNGDTAGWEGNTIVSTVSQVNAGGNPGGYLNSVGTGSGTFDIGAVSHLSALTGSYTGQVWTAKFDVNYLRGNFDDAWLRFRFQDSSHNGWRFHLTDSFPSGAWQSYSVTFDPSWSDAQAIAAGWATDLADGSGSVSFSETLSNVFTTEVRISGVGDVQAGIDNFNLVGEVPEPSTYAMMLGGLGLLAMGWRKRKSS